LHLQAVIEGYEAAHEELQSANEEILSSNEELQSTNEELQTTKEEVDAINEELSTVNDELQARIVDLARLNDDLANVLASVQIPIVILTHDLRIRSFTPAAAPLFNLIGTDIGRPLSDINIGLSVADLNSLLLDVLNTLGVKTVEVQERAGRWYTLRIRPYRTLDNKIDGLVLVLVDIDEIKRATQRIAHARDYAEAIVATVHRPLVVLDPELRLHTANPEFYRTFAVSPGESEGRPMYELGNRQWDIPELRDRLQAVIVGGQDLNQFEVEHTFPRIGRRSVLINARRVAGKEGTTDLILVAIDDITERKQRDYLLQERGEQLLMADARKNEFLAMLAHELRTPLAPIVHAGALLRQAREIDRTSIERAADVIVRQSAHMARLIEDLLDVARITRGKVELRKQHVDLRVSIERAVEAARPLMQSRRHDLLVTLPPAPIDIDADPARLEQVISNLLNNAARYTEPGGRIELTAQQQSGWAVLYVRDNGIGISAEMLAGVFGLFAQADNRLDHQAGGLGIGLTVVRSLVEMHGGSVEARSDGPGHGSTFTVRLPALGAAVSTEPGDAGPLPQSHAARRSAKPHRVLIVEDNEDAAAALGSLLEAWGHDVRIVSDGAAALEAAGTLPPEVILLDIGLPGASGYEVARKLRQLPGLDTTRIVALTGYGQSQDRRRSQEAGFDQHLVKPVTPESLQGLFLRTDDVH
jgi:two-component system, chemotaxis family, CheB/CheR fusion protein